MPAQYLHRSLLIGSLNPAKINAAKTAAQRCLPHHFHKCQGVIAPSGVRDQPFGDEETLLGAVNRVQHMAADWRQARLQYQQVQQNQEPLSQQQDTITALEGHQAYYCSPESLLLAVEGGVLQRGTEDLHCFAWVAAQLASGGKISTARSAEFLLPRQLSQLVLEGMELGAADDLVFGRVQSGQGSGTVGKLTHSLVTRADYYEHTVMMALIPFINPALYPEFHDILEE